MNRLNPPKGSPQPPSPRQQFLSEKSEAGSHNGDNGDDDDFVSRSSLKNLHLECYDECVYNDLPQYLVRISDMRLYSRAELWKAFRALVGDVRMDLETAKQTMAQSGEAQLRKNCKDDIKRLIKYAVFSHRWGEEEPEFRDVSSKIHGRRSPPKGRGYEKLVRFCEKAKEYGCEYVWSDTCCINKESSSELEEAIRAMYRWYRDAFVCIVHLAQSTSVKNFEREQWFTRGWTLQELLAPERLRMYGKDWLPVCPKKHEVQGGNDFPFPNDKLSDFMLGAISDVTRIHSVNIKSFDSRSASLMVSTKMRWASRRKTTRVEDMAYSLLGVFDIAIPIAYGEGERAFQRLLEAIAQRSGDPSFFAWAGPCSRYSMALPASPACYRTTVAAPYCEHDYTILKRGIQLKMVVVRVKLAPLTQPEHYAIQAPRGLKVVGEFARRADEPNPEHSHAVGVVDFGFDSDQAGGQNVGYLSPEKRHFCMLMRITHGRAGSGVELRCRRIDTKGVLPMIACENNKYGPVPLKTVLLEHSRFMFI